MVESQQSHNMLISLLGELANTSLKLWEVPAEASAKLINFSENATYLVSSSKGYRSILRIHRENYHTKLAIASEIAWTRALNKESEVETPNIIPGRNNQDIQQGKVDGLKNNRYMVMFEYVEGEEPNEEQDLVGPFEELGEISAKTHIHSIGWNRPNYFERLEWNIDAFFGSKPIWGKWQDAPAMEKPVLKLLIQQEDLIVKRIKKFGMGCGKFGLIHADMRLANLLIHEGKTRLIDFDDCGIGWFLYDFAAGISFMEDNPTVETLKDAWVRGYRNVSSLSNEEEKEIDTFIMLRRMALLAWIGSHSDTDLAKEQGPEFTKVSGELAEKFMIKMG